MRNFATPAREITRGIDAARALARILAAPGVDFAILGPDEKEDGDSIRLVRRDGTLREAGGGERHDLREVPVPPARRVRAHEYNAFRNEYPKHGGTDEVLHYTQFPVEHLDRLRALMVTPVALEVRYHDPGYVSRHNGEYEALRAIPGLRLVEMPRTRENSYCCCGGGGMWLDSFSRDHTRRRPSDQRVLGAVGTGASTLSICCPYEVSRFEDAVQGTGNEGRLDVRDIAKLIDAAINRP